MQNNRTIVVVDLDGTLIEVNSFPRWVLHVIKRTAAEGNFKSFILAVGLLIFRKVGLLSHYQFKKKMMLLDYSENCDLSFAQLLRGRVRSSVVQALSELDRPLIVLSTAAPVNYAQHLLNFEGVAFDVVLSSYIDDGKLIENYSTEKVNAFKNYFSDAGCDIFFTDHYEDLPMMKYANKVFLVNPSEKTLKMVRDNAVCFGSFR